MTEGQLQTQAARLTRVGANHILTPRQLRYLTARIEGKTKEESKRIAGYSEKSNTHRIENTNKKNGSLKEALEAVGLTQDYLAEKIKEGVDAHKKNFFAFEGKVTDEREIPDYDVRHKFTKTALEVRGDISEGGVNLNLGLIQVGSSKTVELWNAEIENVDKSEITQNNDSINIT